MTFLIWHIIHISVKKDDNPIYIYIFTFIIIIFLYKNPYYFDVFPMYIQKTRDKSIISCRLIFSRHNSWNHRYLSLTLARAVFVFILRPPRCVIEFYEKTRNDKKEKIIIIIVRNGQCFGEQNQRYQHVVSPHCFRSSLVASDAGGKKTEL